MLFSRAVSFLALFSTLGGLSFASPTELGRRTDGGKTVAIEEILVTLKSTTERVLPEIIIALTASTFSETVVASKGTPGTSVEPLLEEIFKALENTHDSLLKFGIVSLGDSVDATAIADLLNGIIKDLAEVISSLGADILLLSGILSKIDSLLLKVLSILGILIPGLLGLITSLLSSVLGITSGALSGLLGVLARGIL